MEEKVFGGKIDIPTAAAIRRIVREEIERAESRRTKRAADGGEVLPAHKHLYIDGYCACGASITRRR